MSAQVADTTATTVATPLTNYLLHLSEQYLTSCHTFSHFLRQVIGLLQRAHILIGKLAFLIPLGINIPIQFENAIFYFIPVLEKSLEP